MTTFEEIKKYLPSYLSRSSQTELFGELKNFPKNIDQRFYTLKLSEEKNIFQGDGIKDLLCV